MLRISRTKRTTYKAALAISCSCVIGLLAFNNFYVGQPNRDDYTDITDFSEASGETGFPFNVVPNIVHLVHLTNNADETEKVELSFIEVVTIKAAHQNQKPNKLIIHCNCYEFHGKYWNMVKDLKGLEVNYIKLPTEIFGQKLSSKNKFYHASDLARIALLMKHGGIYIDRDTYIVKSLDKYRRFEMSLGWRLGETFLTQLLVANRNARFLKLWRDSYHDYKPNSFYYNAGQLPTSGILMLKPELIHRVTRNFGDNISTMLYATNSDEWKTYDSVHLLTRHLGKVKNDTIPEFDLDNIKVYNRSFGQMARLILYGTTHLIV